MRLLAVLLALAQPVEPRLPPLEDLARFPAQWVTAENRDLARRHIRWLEARIAVDRWQEAELTEWLWEARCRADLWEILHTAQQGCCDEYSPWTETEKRQCLAELKRLLGQDYYQGRMPQPVPVYRFAVLGR